MKEQNSLIIIFHLLDITLVFSAEADQLCMYTCEWVCLWPKFCWSFWKWLSTKHISITLRTFWDHDPHRLSKTGGNLWVVPSQFGQNVTMYAAVPVAVLRDSHGSGQIHVMEPGPSRRVSQEDMSRKLILKLIIYFALLIWMGHWCKYS